MPGGPFGDPGGPILNPPIGALETPGPARSTPRPLRASRPTPLSPAPPEKKVGGAHFYLNFSIRRAPSQGSLGRSARSARLDRVGNLLDRSKHSIPAHPRVDLAPSVSDFDDPVLHKRVPDRDTDGRPQQIGIFEFDARP